MILITTALYAEAKPFIQKLNMKRNALKHYQMFEGGDFALIITGVGRMEAGCALTEALMSTPDIDMVVNVGCAGGTPGLYRINRIIEKSTGRTFYPDVFETKLRETGLETFDTVVTENVTTDLVDMEGSAIYQAAKRFVGTAGIVIIKYVTDTLDGAKPDAAAVEKIAFETAENVLNEIELAHNYIKVNRCNMDGYNSLSESARMVSERHRLSLAMDRELKNVIYGISLAGDAAVDKAQTLMKAYAEEEPLKPKTQEREKYKKFLEGLKTVAYEASEDKNAEPWAKAFTHVYVEKSLNETMVKPILDRLSHAERIQITHMKDVFNRPCQTYETQKKGPNLILAEKKSDFLYEGARVCQSFGFEHFYYVSMIMNCVYDCQYCYLAGMYPTGNIAVYVNIEDYFAEIEKKLKEHSLYLCVSFDTDMLALEGIFHFGQRWCEFAENHPNVTIEIRTKSSAKVFLDNCKTVPENVILAWTLSPEKIIERYEKRTAPLSDRLSAMKRASEMGFKVRACFDPCIYTADFEDIYGTLIQKVFSIIPAETLFDVSIGVFRIGRDYLKAMRDNRPASEIVWKPYELEEGVYSYPLDVRSRMMDFMKANLTEYIPAEKIFNWEE